MRVYVLCNSAQHPCGWLRNDANACIGRANVCIGPANACIGPANDV